MTSDSEGKQSYLYPNDDGWLVGPNPNADRGWIFNENIGDGGSVPRTDWLYSDEGGWSKDPTLRVTEANSICGKYSLNTTFIPGERIFGISVESWSTYFGDFTITNKWRNGRPIYQNKHDLFLSVHEIG